MILKLLRISSTDKRTIGAMFINDVFECFTLEDPPQKEKIPGNTRIPSGVYELGWQFLDTELTRKYTKRFPDFFKHHIEVHNVKNFTSIYIHCGSFTKDTDGCILVGENAFSKEDMINGSGIAFEHLYKKILPILDGDEAARLEIIDYA